MMRLKDVFELFDIIRRSEIENFLRKVKIIGRERKSILERDRKNMRERYKISER